ncbi:MAG: transcription termination/antitermination protein NusA [Alphaproteobacteria bacterium]|nr:transcription termination/antitermination protein NusA [Alphaproteobacteria bacterium]OJV45366.1 MAG: transcription termination/antitermination protein NusA [Alphaproteobacteria bacterium 43-37]
MTQFSSRIIRQDLLNVADTVAREKGIDRDSVIEAMEMALQKAARAKYGFEIDLRVSIDRLSGEIILNRILTVVEEVHNPSTEISLAEAQLKSPSNQLGDELKDPLPPMDFGRVAAQTAKQVVVQRVRDVEREKQYEEFKDKIGDVVNGLIRRVEYGNLFLDLGRGEGLLRRDDLIPRETYRAGDRIRAYIYDVRKETKGPQVFLSRNHNQFMVKLFAQEVPEIYDGVIEIKSVARDPGSRAKIAVFTADHSIDPVGACVGMRGSRVQAVVNELQGEKIDIVPWSSNPATFVVNALAPAEVIKVVMDEEAGRIEVVVPDEQLSLAIGRRGQNVRLASQLTGWTIDILTEKEESEKRTEELKTKSAHFIEALNVDEVVAHLLVGEGFSTVEEIAFVHPDDLRSIEGFDDEIAGELQARAQKNLKETEAKLTQAYKDLGVEESMLELGALTPAMLVKLGENKIKTQDDFAELAVDEVKEILSGFNIHDETIGAIIMKARAKWFEDPAS